VSKNEGKKAFFDASDTSPDVSQNRGKNAFMDTSDASRDALENAREKGENNASNTLPPPPREGKKMEKREGRLMYFPIFLYI
jgi:hypothetical protein